MYSPSTDQLQTLPDISPPPETSLPQWETHTDSAHHSVEREVFVNGSNSRECCVIQPHSGCYFMIISVLVHYCNFNSLGLAEQHAEAVATFQSTVSCHPLGEWKQMEKLTNT